MSELVMGTIYAMIGVFALSTAVWFGLRGGRYARGYQKEQYSEKSAE